MAECEKMMELCEESIDRTLTPEEQELLERHLSVCPGCAAYLADLQFMTAALLEEPAFPDSLHASIMAGITEEASRTVIQTHRPNRTMPVLALLAAAAACVVLVLSGALGDRLYNLDLSLAGGGSSGASSDAAPSVDAGGSGLDASGGGLDADDSGFGASDGGFGADNSGFDASGGGLDASDGGFGADNSGFDASGGGLDAGNDFNAQNYAADTASAPSDGSEAIRADIEPYAEEGAPVSEPVEERSAKMGARSGEPAPRGLTANEAGALMGSTESSQTQSSAVLQPQIAAFISNVMEGEVFAACYLVEGGSDLPEIGQVQQRDEHFGYYVADNSPAQLETLLDSLEKAGCTVQTYEEAGVLFNEEAHRVIIVIRLD